MLPTGCTCENTFTMPYSKDEVQALVVTYANAKTQQIILEKELSDCEFSDGLIHVYLSQEDTLKFDDDIMVEIQIKVKLINNLVTKSKPIKEWTDKVLNREVI